MRSPIRKPSAVTGTAALDGQRLERLLAARAADQRLLLDNRLDDEVARPDLRDYDAPRGRRREREAPHGALFGIEGAHVAEDGLRDDRAPALGERDVELHLQRDHAAIRGAQQEGTFRGDGGHRDLATAER